MGSLIQDWLDAEANVCDAVNKANELEIKATGEAQLPSGLRPAEARDIVEGAIIWYIKKDYPDFHGKDFCWKYVSDVLNPNSEFKAYHASDGCRYGLHDAFVEIDHNKDEDS